MPDKVVCLVTIDGTGPESMPENGVSGYADALHEHLTQHLDASSLGKNPSHVGETDLARLGTWRADGTIDHSDAPLGDGAARIAHVVLSYCHLQDQGPGVDASAVVPQAHAVAVRGIVRLVVQDAIAAAGPPNGTYAAFMSLENQVTAYVCRNDLRVGVQRFVREALLRLCARDDVAGVVLNTQGQATVVGFDVLRDFPHAQAPRVRGFVTAGSPLRKYVDLFQWGNEVGSLAAMGAWTNFRDPHDPVADSLGGDSLAANIIDRVVDNGAAGGVQAHNYWDNDSEVVAGLADVLRAAAGGETTAPAVPDQAAQTPDSPLPAPPDQPAQISTDSQPPAPEPAAAVAVMTLDIPIAPPSNGQASDTPTNRVHPDGELAPPFGLLRTWFGFRPSGPMGGRT